MTTPEIDAARQALREAEAEVDRLQAKLRAELGNQDARGFSSEDRPQRLGWSDGVAAARARYPKGNGTGDAASSSTTTAEVRDDADASAGRTPADGRAAARRRTTTVLLTDARPATA